MQVATSTTTLRRAGPRRPLQSIYSVKQMRQALARERARSDRNDHGFVLAVFWPASGGWWHRHRLARLVCRRARVMDEVGWFEAGRLGVILPYASADSAAHLAGEIRRQGARKGIDVQCRVYSYPSDDEAGDGHKRQSDRDGDSHKGEAARRAVDAPAQVAEELFLRPLPVWKRVMDLIGASIGLIIASPLMAVAAIAIKLNSPGPVLFRQKRAGWGGRPFTILKFRTMTDGAEALRDQLKQFSEQDGPAFKLSHDPRVTAVGRFLRATSLDELPQLFNVLLGDMSLVGPRPLPLAESSECSQWQRARLDVTPGLTCIWQVHGRSRVPFDDWLRMDIQYIRSRSLVNDLKILVQTVPAVVLRRGAH